jgi:hypothetical protein
VNFPEEIQEFLEQALRKTVSAAATTTFPATHARSMKELPSMNVLLNTRQTQEGAKWVSTPTQENNKNASKQVRN